MKLPPFSHSSFAALLVAAAAMSAAPMALAQEEAPPNMNVIVNDSALDDLPYANEEPLLPAPDRRPVSRLLVSPSGQSIGSSDLSSSPEATYSAVPTTPIQSVDLNDTDLNAGASPTTEVDPSTGLPTTPTMDITGPQPEAPTEPATGLQIDSTADEGSAAAGEPAGSQTMDQAGGGEAPAPAPEQAPDPAVTEQASAEQAETGEGPLPNDPATMLEGQIRIPYAEGSDIIPEAAKGQIVGLIERMNSDYSLHLQVLAYAAGDEDEVGLARGISLARALAMRNFLTENGLDLSRMDVRALGNTAREDPADRVDLIPLSQ
jgi:outer membrane protein OmpA-like peptidoglycan-associated protein